jgi:hypothetical protein
MTNEEWMLGVLTEHKDGWDKLVNLVSELDVRANRVKSIEVVITDITSQPYSIKFDGDQLDTFLLFNELMDLTKTRSEYLETKQKELKNYVQRQI